MILNLKIRYITQDNEIICFNHAVIAAYKGIKVEPEVDDFGQDGDMRSTCCKWCLHGVPRHKKTEYKGA